MIEISTEKRTENFCSDALSASIQFSVLFWLTPRSTEKILVLKNFLRKLGTRKRDFFYVISDLFLIGL